MLKLVLTLISDWRAYRRAISANRRPHVARYGFGHVSIWPVDAPQLEAPPAEAGSKGLRPQSGRAASGIASVEAK